MSILDWFRAKPSIAPADKPAANQPQAHSAPTEKEIFKAPESLAGWVNQYLIEGLPVAENYKMLPDEESRKNLGITVAQRERFVREISVLRIAGAAFVVKLYCEDDFYLRFLNEVSIYLAAHLDSELTPMNALEIATAIEAYIGATEAQSPEEMSKLYMRRVYDDSDHYLKLSMAGVGFLSVDWFMDSHSIFRDAYFKIVAGMPYESWKLLYEAMEKAKREVPSE